jgi:hypothetical protein
MQLKFQQKRGGEGRGSSRGGESCSLLESTEIPVELDVHMKASKEIGRVPVMQQFDTLEQVVCLYAELLGSKDIQEEFLATGKSYASLAPPRDDISLPLLVRLSLDLSDNGLNDGVSAAPESVQNLKDAATCFERAIQGIFDKFYSLILTLLKHRASSSAAAAALAASGYDEHSYIEYDEVNAEEGASALHAIPGFGGCGTDSKALSSRNDVYMKFAVNICHILDVLLDLSAKLLLALKRSHVSAALESLLAPTALPLKLSELSVSILQYDWANSRLKDEVGHAGYTYSSKDLSFFVHLSLKHAPSPLEKIQFMVNDLFLDELKVWLCSSP